MVNVWSRIYKNGTEKQAPSKWYIKKKKFNQKQVECSTMQ